METAIKSPVAEEVPMLPRMGEAPSSPTHRPSHLHKLIAIHTEVPSCQEGEETSIRRRAGDNFERWICLTLESLDGYEGVSLMRAFGNFMHQLLATLQLLHLISRLEIFVKWRCNWRHRACFDLPCIMPSAGQCTRPSSLHEA